MAKGGNRGGMRPGGPPGGMQQLLQQAQKAQRQLAAAQEELAEARVTGTAGGGLVEATCSGGGEVVGISIKPAAVDPDDVESLEDLVLAAVRDAQKRASDLADEKMGPLAGGGLPGLPL